MRRFLGTLGKGMEQPRFLGQFVIVGTRGPWDEIAKILGSVQQIIFVLQHSLCVQKSASYLSVILHVGMVCPGLMGVMPCRFWSHI